MVAGIMTAGTEKLVGAAWSQAQKPAIRSYEEQVLDRLDRLPHGFKVASYGQTVYGKDTYDHKYVTVGDPANGKPTIFINGGVHGYEEGGVKGVFEFIEKHVPHYAKDYNFVIIPCVSPWAYEHDRRLTGNKKNPNRNFFDGSKVPEATLMMALVRKLNIRYLMAIDCHETTWTDPVILKQEGATDIDPDNIFEGAYLLEACEDKTLQLGNKMVAQLEALGLPVDNRPTGPDDKHTNDNGVLRGLEKVIPTLCMSFMTAATDTRHAPTEQAFTTEPYVTEELFYAKDGLKRRVEMQIVQICAALDGAKGRPAPSPLALKRAG